MLVYQRVYRNQDGMYYVFDVFLYLEINLCTVLLFLFTCLRIILFPWHHIDITFTQVI